MLEPVEPRLRIGTCLSDGISCWTGHLPRLAFATLLTVFATIVLPIFWAAFFTGLLMMCIRGLDEKLVTFEAGWRPFTSHPFRFLFISLWLPIGRVAIVTLTLGYLFFAIPDGFLPNEISEQIAPFRTIARDRLSAPFVKFFPGFQTAPYNWSGAIPLTVGTFFLWTNALLFALRITYLPILVADRDLPVIDAYVESRNAVLRFGQGRHAIIGLLCFALLSLPSYTADDADLLGLLRLIAIPFALCLVGSAYQQTLVTER